MISPNRFRYAGIFSNELNMPDLITCVAFDSDNGDIETHLAREGVSSESYDGRYKRIHNFKYTDTFKCTLTLTKSNFGDFTQEEVRSTLKWLTQNDKPALLEIFYDDSNVVSWASIGGFVNCSLRKLANNRTVAVVAEWDSVHPFCLSDLYTVTKTISSATDNTITINIDTDDNKPVYPRITVQHNGSVVNIPTGTVYTATSDMVENTVYFNGTTYYWKSDSKVSGTTKPDYDWETVTVDHAYTDADTWKDETIYYYETTQTYYWIEPYYFHESTTNPSLATTGVRFTNKHTDFLNQSTVLDQTIVKNNNTTELVTIDGANKIISSNSVNRIFDNDFNWVWMSLLDGKNEITVEGNCTVTIVYREIRKVGEY